MANVEIETCGPVGTRLSKESIRDILIAFAGGLAFAVSFSRFWRIARAPGESTAALLFALGAAASAAVMAWGFARLLRREDDWGIAQAGPLGFVLLLRLHERVPAGSPWRLIAAMLPLAPAALLIWSYLRMIRRSDELQRRIVYEALGFAYAITLSAAVVGALAEGAGAARLSWLWIAAVLVFSWTIGLVLASRRYR